MFQPIGPARIPPLDQKAPIAGFGTPQRTIAMHAASFPAIAPDTTAMTINLPGSGMVKHNLARPVRISRQT